ncbi:MAG: hypothetical protein CVU55_05985 [Deltaproteobacteria bacterium HGW-Deltaproteobacteria-13]|nr:MAG: hypothetical protein CVU55_05985 [Deltaproteobacteria bacterium HGW-Deltaproteobacteria-13]
MAGKTMRKNYFISFSIQFKYILISVLPVLLMSLLCIYFVMDSGKSIEKQQTKIIAELSSIDAALKQIQAVSLPKDAQNQLAIFAKKLSILQDELNIQYYYLVEEWAKIRMQLLAVLFLGIICVSVISIIFSHRIAGPIFRLQKAIEAMQEGRDTGGIKVRPSDEYLALADSLEKLRVVLKDKGCLK